MHTIPDPNNKEYANRYEFFYLLYNVYCIQHKNIYKYYTFNGYFIRLFFSHDSQIDYYLHLLTL